MQDSITLSEEAYIDMLNLLGDVHTFRELDNGLIYYNTLLSHGQNRKNLKLISNVLRKMGFIYLNKDDVGYSKIN